MIDRITKEAKALYNKIAKEKLMTIVLASSSKKPKPREIVGTVLFPDGKE